MPDVGIGLVGVSLAFGLAVLTVAFGGALGAMLYRLVGGETKQSEPTAKGV